MMVHEENGESGSPAAAWIAKFAAPVADAAAGKALGFALPLAGLSFAVKDNIDVAGAPTTAACPAFDRLPRSTQPWCSACSKPVHRWLGKTNLDQFACGLNGTRSPYGAVPNAFDPRYVWGGSSSGSAYVVATGEVDFALGTDTAGSGRVPAGLNNIVGLKPSRGLLSTFGVVPAAQSADCVSIFARTVATAVDVLLAAVGHDARDPYSRDLALSRKPLPARFRFGVPDDAELLRRRRRPSGRSTTPPRACRPWAARRCTIYYAPLAEAAALLYESALVAERYAAVREFFDAHGDDVIEPVRGILASGRTLQRRRPVRGPDAAARAGAAGRADVAATSTCCCCPPRPRTTRARPMRADPVALNRNLGAYTNFVNLLDYAALSVPSSLRARRPALRHHADRPLRQRPRSWPSWASATTTPPGSRKARPAQPLPAAAPPCRGLQRRRDRAGRRGRRAPVGHAAQRPAHRARRDAAARHHHRARTTASTPCPAPCRPSPACCAWSSDEGAAIALEVWEMPLAQVRQLSSRSSRRRWASAALELADGSRVQGFICEAHALAGARGHHPPRRLARYIASRAAAPTSSASNLTAGVPMSTRDTPSAHLASRRQLLQAGAAGLAVLAAPAIVRAQAAPKIRIGYWPVAAGLPFFAAVDKGYFKEAGLDVEPLKFAGAQQVMEAMLAGPLRRQRQRHRLGQPRHRRDRAAGPLQDLLHQPQQRQERARRIHRRQGQPHQDHGRPEGQAASPRAPASRTSRCARPCWSAPAPPARRVSELPIGQHVAALVAGQVDACYTLEPTGTIGRMNGTTRVHRSRRGRQVHPRRPDGARGTAARPALTTEFIKKNPEVAKKYIAAYARGVELVRTKPDEARQYLKGYTAIEGPLTGRGAAGVVHALQRVHAQRRRVLPEVLRPVHREGHLREAPDGGHAALQGLTPWPTPAATAAASPGRRRPRTAAPPRRSRALATGCCPSSARWCCSSSGTWWCASASSRPILLPTPADTLGALLTGLAGGPLLTDFAVTVWRTLQAFADRGRRRRAAGRAARQQRAGLPQRGVPDRLLPLHAVVGADPAVPADLRRVRHQQGGHRRLRRAADRGLQQRLRRDQRAQAARDGGAR